jgi:hypothetical protein
VIPAGYLSTYLPTRYYEKFENYPPGFRVLGFTYYEKFENYPPGFRVLGFRVYIL